MEVIKESKVVKQFVRFCFIGISNTVVGYMLNVGTLVTLRSFNLSWDYYAGNLNAFFLGVLWVFYWNNRFVFKQMNSGQRIWWKALLKTYITYGITGLLVANVMSWIWVEYLGVSKWISPILNLMITVPLNFIINKFWTFKGDAI